MKEISSYYKAQQLTQIDRKTTSDPKPLKKQTKNNDDDELAKIVKPTDHALTPFNYEPYVRKSGPFAMFYEPLLAGHLKTPNTHYIH